jgi:hypothetical protein
MHDAWGAVDLALEIWPPSSLGEVEEIRGQKGDQGHGRPQAEDQQRVAEVLSVEVDDVPRTT